jgi:hypothetical protein
MLAAIPVLAHSWYPLYCCGDKDCFPVACDQLVGTVYDKDQVQAKLLAFLKA